MPKAEKIRAVEGLVEELRDVRGIFLADFQGLDVASISGLRKLLREKDSQLRVVKNTLARLAFRQLELQDLENYLDGPTALAYSREDAVAPVKVLFDFAKEHEKPVVRGGIVEGEKVGPERVAEIAQLPSREALVARLLQVLNGPAQGIGSALNAVIRHLVATLDEVAKTRSGGEQAPSQAS